MKIKETEKAYIAGFIDGEGTISVTSSKRNRPTEHIILTPYITIANTNRHVLEVIKKYLGFYDISIHRNYPKSSNNKICYRIFFTGRKRIIKVLELLIPYLIIKKKNAELVLKFVKLREQHVINQYNSAYTKKEIQLVRELKKVIGNQTVRMTPIDFKKVYTKNPVMPKRASVCYKGE